MDIGGISGYNSGLIENVYSNKIPSLINGSSGNIGELLVLMRTQKQVV